MAEFTQNQNASYSTPYGLYKLAKDIAIQVLWHQPKRESIYSFVAEYLKVQFLLQDKEKEAEFIVRELLDSYLIQCDSIVSQRSRLSAEEENRAAKIIQVAFREFQARQRPSENEYFMNNDSLNIEAFDQGEAVPENYVERNNVNRDQPMDTTSWEENRHRAASVIQQKYRRISANSNREYRPPAEPQMRWRQRFPGDNETCTLTVDAIEAVIATSRAAITTQEPWLEADNVVALEETTQTYHVSDLPESVEETHAATEESSSWETITGTDTDSSSMDLFETTDFSRTDLLETTDINRTGSLDHSTITDTHSSTYILENTDIIRPDFLETTDSSRTDLLETTDINRTGSLDHSTITDTHSSTYILENTVISRADFLETTDSSRTDLLETTDIIITKSLDALIVEVLKKSGQSLNFGETETQSFVESSLCDEEVEGTCDEMEQLETCAETFHDELQMGIEKQVDERTLLDEIVDDAGARSCVDYEINTAAHIVKKELSTDFLESQGIISDALNILAKSSKENEL